MNVSGSCRSQIYISLLLSVVTFALFSPVLNHDFLNFDDDRYVTRNTFVRDGLTWRGISISMSAIYASNWHPLTWLSHMTDCELFGLKPRGHHLTNLCLHVANTLLLFALLHRMTRATWRSALVAAFFAWHPMHVESVAWIAERKDVLSTFFGFLGLWCYARHAENLKNGRRLNRWFFGTVISMMLSLASKPMLVTLPFIMLLLDVWPLNRVEGLPVIGSERISIDWRKLRHSLFILIREKTFFFALTLISCFITFRAQRTSGAVASTDYISIPARLANALVSYVRYVFKTLWPSDLAVLYPHPISWPVGWIIGSTAILLAITIFVVRNFRERPQVFTGWFWFVGTLVPVIGIVQVGEQSMADRYSYVPSVGLFIAAVWGLYEATRSVAWQRAVGVSLSVLTLAGCLVQTRSQLRYWENSRTLFEHTLAITQNNSIAHNNYGIALYETGESQQAAWHFSEAIRIKPESLEALKNLGNLKYRAGELQEAVKCYEAALRISPDAEMEFNLANTLSMRGEGDEAKRHYLAALQMRPNDPDMWCVYGAFLSRQSQIDDAITATKRAIDLRSEFAEAHNQLGTLLVRRGSANEAFAEFAHALRIKPQFAEAHVNWGEALEAAGRVAEAVTHYQAALQVDAHSAHAHNNLGIVFAKQGNSAEAVTHFRELVRLEPGNSNAHYNLANALVDSRNLKEAASHYDEAIRLNPADSRAREKLGRIKGQISAEELVP